MDNETAPHAVARISLDNITEFQKDLHYPEIREIIDLPPLSNLEGVSIEKYFEDVNALEFVADIIKRVSKCNEHLEREESCSNFSKKFKRFSWGVKTLCKLNGNQTDSENSFTYECNNKFSILQDIYIEDPLPSLRVAEKHQDQVRIAWVHNMGHNRIPRASFLFGDQPVQSITSTWADTYIQHFMPSGYNKGNTYKEAIGAVPELEELNTFLPSYDLTPPQSWFYIDDNCPLYLSDTKAKHIYSFESEIKELLRIQMRNKETVILDDGTEEVVYGEWEETKYDNEYMRDIIEGIPKDDKLKTPKVWAKYVLLDEEEEKWLRKNAPTNRCIKDVITKQTSKTIPYRDTETINFKAGIPTLAIFWSAQMISKNNSRTSNYTTSPNFKDGHNPCYRNNLESPDGVIFENMSTAHLSRMTAFYEFPSTPYEKGYNSWCFSYKIGKSYADVTYDSKSDTGLTLKVSLQEDDNTFNDKERIKKNRLGVNEEGEEFDPVKAAMLLNKQKQSSKHEAGPQFRIIYHQLIYRKMTLTRDNEGLAIDLVVT